ncbi:MAG: LytR C-terminal domain-containing protein [Candidatus Cloacimonetes bacterium]|nr:LytR C-terminal domain-containing protein [Candidatus Cloacimonadota bacterium]MDY0367505.1 LytR C-terminal domain-containing protein [Candidatus Syntrophosphaera sp.]
MRTHSLKMPLLWLAVVLLSLVLAYLIYVQIIVPGRNSASLQEENLPALKVVVKNGCGVENLATDYSDYVKDKNMDVVSMGDTPQPIWNKSVIEVKTDDKQDLARLQKMTGIKRYTLAVDPDAPAPFVIILGDDFEEYMKP